MTEGNAIRLVHQIVSDMSRGHQRKYQTTEHHWLTGELYPCWPRPRKIGSMYCATAHSIAWAMKGVEPSRRLSGPRIKRCLSELERRGTIIEVRYPTQNKANHYYTVTI